MNCRTCHQPIPTARLDALPQTTTCVACSAEEKMMGVMLWDHKTAPYIHVVTPTQHAHLKQHDRRSVHSNMPMGTRTPTGVQSSVSRSLRPVQIAGTIVDTRPRARKCPHKDAPQASAYGMCLDCAMAWYANRLP